MTIFERLTSFGVIPVITIDTISAAVPLGGALVAGGLPCAEITLRTPNALEAIRFISNTYPTMLIGAGTVLTIVQAKQAVTAGAHFLVSPGFAPDLVEWCTANTVPLLPGVLTPTEIMQALAMGITHVKWFPAEESGGVRTLKALTAPFPSIKFIPTGGITPTSLAFYLALPSVVACGGSWIAPRSLMAEGRFDDIQQLAHAAVALVRQSRQVMNGYG